MPEPLGALALSDRTSLSLGGGASFFSNFGAANANVNGTLVFTQSPPKVVRSTTAQFPVKVMAKTGGGSPIELADITLSIMNNNGVPAELLGSFKLCNGSTTTQPVGCTKELDGIADFLVSITKAGGYIMCANGTAEGFTFAQACTNRFNVRN